MSSVAKESMWAHLSGFLEKHSITSNVYCSNTDADNDAVINDFCDVTHITIFEGLNHIEERVFIEEIYLT